MNNLKKNLILTLAAIFLGSLANIGIAATGNWNAKVTRILTDDVLYGGCMALLSVTGTAGSTAPIDCPQQWIAMDCDATLLGTSTTSKGKNKLAAMQLALVTDAFVTVYATDTPKAGGLYCIAVRVDNFASGATP